MMAMLAIAVSFLRAPGNSQLEVSVYKCRDMICSLAASGSFLLHVTSIHVLPRLWTGMCGMYTSCKVSFNRSNPRGSTYSTIPELGPKTHTVSGCSALSPWWHYIWTLRELVNRSKYKTGFQMVHSATDGLPPGVFLQHANVRSARREEHGSCAS